MQNVLNLFSRDSVFGSLFFLLASFFVSLFLGDKIDISFLLVAVVSIGYCVSGIHKLKKITSILSQLLLLNVLWLPCAAITYFNFSFFYIPLSLFAFLCVLFSFFYNKYAKVCFSALFLNVCFLFLVSRNYDLTTSVLYLELIGLAFLFINILFFCALVFSNQRTQELIDDCFVLVGECLIIVSDRILDSDYDSCRQQLIEKLNKIDSNLIALHCSFLKTDQGNLKFLNQIYYSLSDLINLDKSFLLQAKSVCDKKILADFCNDVSKQVSIQDSVLSIKKNKRYNELYKCNSFFIVRLRNVLNSYVGYWGKNYDSAFFSSKIVYCDESNFFDKKLDLFLAFTGLPLSLLLSAICSSSLSLPLSIWSVMTTLLVYNFDHKIFFLKAKNIFIGTIFSCLLFYIFSFLKLSKGFYLFILFISLFGFYEFLFYNYVLAVFCITNIVFSGYIYSEFADHFIIYRLGNIITGLSVPLVFYIFIFIFIKFFKKNKFIY